MGFSVVTTERGFAVQASVDFGAAEAIYQAGLVLIKKASGIVCIDLSKVEHVDSAALAVFLAWLNEARGLGVNIIWQAVPSSVVRMAKTYGLSEWIS